MEGKGREEKGGENRVMREGDSPRFTVEPAGPSDFSYVIGAC